MNEKIISKAGEIVEQNTGERTHLTSHSVDLTN